jgi:hypothetical protein
MTREELAAAAMDHGYTLTPLGCIHRLSWTVASFNHTDTYTEQRHHEQALMRLLEEVRPLIKTTTEKDDFGTFTTYYLTIIRSP